MATTGVDVRGFEREEKKVIFASSLGTVFEWYDFYLYATLAPLFAALFFPQGNETAALLSAFEPHAWEYMLVQVQAQKDRWYEYYANGEKLVGLENKAIFQVLNTLGEQGWELVGMLPSGDFYFKRPVTD